MTDSAEYEQHGRIVLKSIPWIKKEEFETLYAQLYSEKVVDKRWAVDRIEAWRSRDQFVPVAVEATEAFVRATILDCIIQNNIIVCNYPDVALMYNMALIRFVNLISEQFQKGERPAPLKLIARKLGIPGDIIQLRNQASHSETPPIAKAREAAEFCLKWLEEHYWKNATVNCLDFCSAVDDSEGEEKCKEALLNFQKLQYERLYQLKKSTQKKEKNPIKQAIATVNSLTKRNGTCLVKVLVMPEFLLSLTAFSRPLLKSTDRFIEEEVVVLPKSMQSFWQPVIKALHRNHLLGELMLNLLKSHKNLDDRDQRMAIAWVLQILKMTSNFDDTQEASNSEVYSFGKKEVLNWFLLMEVCVKNYTKYTPAVLPLYLIVCFMSCNMEQMPLPGETHHKRTNQWIKALSFLVLLRRFSEHMSICFLEQVFPPLSPKTKNCIAGLCAIANGALNEKPSIDVPSENRTVHGVENIKTVMELQNVINRGETSFYHSENKWIDFSDNTEWDVEPVGIICGLENRVLDSKGLQYDNLSHDEANSETPGEPAVVAMECDDSRHLSETTEVPVENEKMEETLEVNEDEFDVGETNPDCCNADDILPF